MDRLGCAWKRVTGWQVAPSLTVPLFFHRAWGILQMPASYSCLLAWGMGACRHAPWPEGLPLRCATVCLQGPFRLRWSEKPPKPPYTPGLQDLQVALKSSGVPPTQTSRRRSLAVILPKTTVRHLTPQQNASPSVNRSTTGDVPTTVVAGAPLPLSEVEVGMVPCSTYACSRGGSLRHSRHARGGRTPAGLATALLTLASGDVRSGLRSVRRIDVLPLRAGTSTDVASSLHEQRWHSNRRQLPRIATAR